ncbi:hypothetical protein ACQUSR_15230 [Streptomyces sp. P1-3]|uniref:hypothetical protein n=1 Tax=Streptomyces sp. P1-3 TaxID=3421658 RepID=UPI003D35E90D
MNTGLKVGAFATALAATFGTAYAVGGSVDRISAAERTEHHRDHGDQGDQGDQESRGDRGGHGDHGDRGDHGGHAADQGHPDRTGGEGRADHPAGGLQISESGYTLDLRTPRVEADRRAELRFTVRDRDGRPVTAYRESHGKELHLILAARDLGTFRHLHPTRSGDGTWRTTVDLPKAGDYRVLADFAPAAGDGRNLTLGADLAASGAYEPADVSATARTATVDGYTVTLRGGLTPGEARELTLTVARDGRPVTDLQPYLEAYGHLVALRSGDLAYLHVHPGGAPGDAATGPGPDISFTATAPSAGTYRLFLDFKHDGKVRTAAFTLPATTA